MADKLEELAAMEAGTGSEEEAVEGEVSPETPAEPSVPQVVLDRFGDVENDPEARAKLAAAYDELNNFAGRQGQEYGQTRQQLEQLEARLAEFQQSQQQQPEPAGEPGGLTPEAWTEWYETQPLEAIAYVLHANNESLMAQIDQRITGVVSPIQTRQQKEQSTALAAKIHNDLGADVFNRNYPAIEAALKRDPQLREGDPEVVYDRIMGIVGRAEWERDRAATQSNGKPAPTRVEGGGSGGRPVGSSQTEELSPAEQIKRDMLQNVVQKDRFGNPIRKPA